MLSRLQLHERRRDGSLCVKWEIDSYLSASPRLARRVPQTSACPSGRERMRMGREGDGLHLDESEIWKRSVLASTFGGFELIS